MSSEDIRSASQLFIDSGSSYHIFNEIKLCQRNPDVYPTVQVKIENFPRKASRKGRDIMNHLKLAILLHTHESPLYTADRWNLTCVNKISKGG